MIANNIVADRYYLDSNLTVSVTNNTGQMLFQDQTTRVGLGNLVATTGNQNIFGTKSYYGGVNFLGDIIASSFFSYYGDDMNFYTNGGTLRMSLGVSTLYNSSEQDVLNWENRVLYRGWIVADEGLEFEASDSSRVTVRNEPFLSSFSIIGFADWRVDIYDGKVKSSSGFSLLNNKFNVDASGNVQSLNFGTEVAFLTVNGTIYAGTTLLSGLRITGVLPNAANTSGLIYTIKQVSTGTGVVTPVLSQRIDGATSRTLSGIYRSVSMQSDGSNWYVISQI